MDVKKLKLEILENINKLYKIKICDENQAVRLNFNVDKKELKIYSSNDLARILKENEYQLRKLLHNKQPRTYYVGFKLDFSIIDGKDIAAFNNKNNIVVKDHGDIKVIKDCEKEDLIEIYTDGSYNENLEKGAYSILKKDLNGSYESHQFSSILKDSATIELQAVIKALEIYKSDVRIMTDSQYVRKGITEWTVHWKLNNWVTANGTKAKNINKWIKLEKLCEGRRIEFGYVKAHNDHFENEYCDLLARNKRESMKSDNKRV
ncbi:MAG: ribonuclease HI [Tissierellales bacterium]|jgi:ribonuclease HI|nr:ribonuclease HI [Tissierellales bacterium]